MRNPFQHRDALWALFTQALVIVLFFPVVWYFWQMRAALSLVIGGLVCLLPNFYLYRRVFSFFGATHAKQIVKAFYLGEAVKLVLTGVCFVAALLIPWAKPLWIFLGYLLAQFGFWLAPIYLSLCRKLVK